MNTIYVDIFIEHLKSVFLIPIGNDLTLSTMRLMNPDELYIIPLLIGLSAVLLGAMFNWWLGSFFSRYRTAFHGLSEEDYNRFSGFAQRYGVWLIMLWWLPFCTLLPFIAGFFRVRWMKVCILIVMGYVLKLYIE